VGFDFGVFGRFDLVWYLPCVQPHLKRFLVLRGQYETGGF
jgi:hypothetical protein